METDEQIHKRRNMIATIVTIVILVFVGLFVARVVYFTSLIRSGDIDLSDFSSTGSLTTSLKLAGLPIPDGSFDVVSSDDPSLGASDAPVTIVEFADFGCPYSREASLVMRALAREHPDTVRYIYRDFPITEIHPLAMAAAQAGECAQEQGAFWAYHDKLYQNQNDLSVERLGQFAREVGMNESRFVNCLNSGRFEAEVQQDYEDGLQAGVRGTPTFFINGHRVSGSIPRPLLEQIIESLKNGYGS
jgi:hypothetical protein